MLPDSDRSSESERSSGDSNPSSRPSDDSEKHASIARAGTDAVFLRQRMERPARLGRIILSLFGGVTASAGAAVWVTTRSEPAVGLIVFGGVLAALGVVQHLLYQRDRAHWPDQVYLWTDGLELVLSNGEVRGASWSDPDFALELVARRAPPPAQREFLLMWLPDSRIPPVELSEEGFDMVAKAAVDHELKITHSRRGSRRDSLQLVEIRQNPAVIEVAPKGLPNPARE